MVAKYIVRCSSSCKNVADCGWQNCSSAIFVLLTEHTQFQMSVNACAMKVTTSACCVKTKHMDISKNMKLSKNQPSAAFHSLLPDGSFQHDLSFDDKDSEKKQCKSDGSVKNCGFVTVDSFKGLQKQKYAY